MLTLVWMKKMHGMYSKKLFFRRRKRSFFEREFLFGKRIRFAAAFRFTEIKLSLAQTIIQEETAKRDYLNSSVMFQEHFVRNNFHGSDCETWWLGVCESPKISGTR